MHLWRGRPSTDDPDLALIETTIDERVALAALLEPSQRHHLCELTGLLVRTKRWEAARGFELDPEMVVTIAANAAIPVLALDPAIYRGVRSVIVQPSTTRSTGRRAGPAVGVFDDTQTSIIGEASPHAGPVSIAWDAARHDSLHPASGRNVVIHEFAHKIDMADGFSDGTPPLRGPALARWSELLADEYDHAATRPGDDALRSYAWTNRAEFFAVATEAFFCTPTRLLDAKPRLYGAFSDFYGQDPAAWAQAPAPARD